MKNIEKYTNTKDALEAYKRLNTCNSFDKWLELEYKEPSTSTLMEAAEAVKNAWYANVDASYRSNLEISLENLADAIKREKAKPIRNCDKYKTASEALDAFIERCATRTCADCELERLGREQGICSGCRFVWLYAEADKEAA